MSRRAWLISGTLGLVALAAVFMASFKGSFIEALEPVGWVAAVLGVAAGYLALPVWTRRTRVSTPGQLDEAERALRIAVASYVRDELSRRGLIGESILPVRWRRDARTTPTLLFGPDATLSDDVPERAIIAGDAGIGKTTICLLLCRAMLGGQGPVPVMVPASSWHGDRDLDAWLASWINDNVLVLRNHAAYGATAVAGLVAAGRVMCVIDGLDEVPKADRDMILAAIAATDADRHVLITCRTGPLRSINRRLRGMRERELCAPFPHEAMEYLADHDNRWTESYPKNSNGTQFRRLLHNPLSIYLLRHVYFDENREVDSSETLERRLWRGLVPSMYRASAKQLGTRRKELLVPATGAKTPWSPAKADRWIRFLVTELAEETGELRWWTFATKVKKWITPIRIVCSLASVAMHFLVRAVMGLPPDPLGSTMVFLSTIVFITFSLHAFQVQHASAPHFDDNPTSFGAAAVVIAGLLIGWLVDPLLGILGGLLAGMATADVLRRWAGHKAGGAYGTPRRALWNARLRSFAVLTMACTLTVLLGVAELHLLSTQGDFLLATSSATIAAFALGSTTWGRFWAARLACALRGQLPLRLGRFLEDASRLGIVYRVGPHYCLRHSRLKHFLDATSPGVVR